MPDPVLRVEDLSRRLGGRLLWGGLRLDLESGQCQVLQGPSGAGKTLLLRTLVGLEPLESGSVSWFGTPLDDWATPRLRARAMLVPQDPTLPEPHVAGLLAGPLALRVHGNRPFDRTEAERLLHGLGRDTGFLDRETDRLSGGERQVVALVRAVLLQPDVLLLDEPTAHLDPDTRRAVEELLANWLDRGDRAAIWTTHDRDQGRRVERGGSITLERP